MWCCVWVYVFKPVQTKKQEQQKVFHARAQVICTDRKWTSAQTKTEKYKLTHENGKNQTKKKWKTKIKNNNMFNILNKT